MAISETPGSAGTTATFRAESDLRGTIRRRPSAAGAVSDSTLWTNSPESENSLKDLLGDSVGNDDRDRIGAGDCTVESANLENEKKESLERFGNDNDRRLDFAELKLAYRPSAPAHRIVRESPLSSGAIFQQVAPSHFDAFCF